MANENVPDAQPAALPDQILDENVANGEPAAAAPPARAPRMEINIEDLTDSESDDDVGLPYSDHNYISRNPQARPIQEPLNFPLIKGLSEFDDDPKPAEAKERERIQRPSVRGPYGHVVGGGGGGEMQAMPGPVATGIALHHQQGMARKLAAASAAGSSGMQSMIPTGYRKAQGEDFNGPPPAGFGPSPLLRRSQHAAGMLHPSVTTLKKAGRPSKNDSPGQQRLLQAALQKQAPSAQVQAMGQQQQQAGGLNEEMRPVGAAPLVTPARGQKPLPRGRFASAGGPRRELLEDGTPALVYGAVPAGPGSSMMQTSASAHPLHHPMSQQQPQQQAQQQAMVPQQPYRSASMSPRKQPYRTVTLAAEDAHKREMMEAAQNALAHPPAPAAGPSSVLLSPSLAASMHGDLPRTPGRNLVSSPASSLDHRTLSESQVDYAGLGGPVAINEAGLPITPRARGRPRGSRSRTTSMRSVSSTGTGIGAGPGSGQAHQQQQLMQHQSPSSTSSSQLVPTPPTAGVGSPQRMAMPAGMSLSPQRRTTMGHIKSPTGGALLQSPSTMASAQQQMSAQQHHGQQQMTSSSPSRSSMTAVHQAGLHPRSPLMGGSQAAPMVSASGSHSYMPRGRKRKSSGGVAEEDVAAQARILAQTILKQGGASRPQLLSSSSGDDEEMVVRGRPNARGRGAASRARAPAVAQPAVSSSANEEEEEDEGWSVECICGVTTDDGEMMVACDACNRWQHIDCLFPEGDAPDSQEPFFCTVCQPRPTKLSSDEARERMKRRKEEQVREKLNNRKKKRDEEQRRPPSAHQRAATTATPATSSMTSSAAATIAPATYLKIDKNNVSANARRLTSVSRMANNPGVTDILGSLKRNPRAMSVVVNKLGSLGLMSTMNLGEGSHIMELRGHIRLRKDCAGRELAGCLVPFTFLYTLNGEAIVIDARKEGNEARFVRRSCKPNAKLEHVMSGSELHFLIISTKDIDETDEIKIPHDDDAAQSTEPVMCACDNKEGPCSWTAFNDRLMAKKSGATLVNGRRSAPTNGTLATPRNMKPAARAVTDKRKSSTASGKKGAAGNKKGKKGAIKLRRPTRKSQAGGVVDMTETSSTEDASERVEKRPKRGEKRDEEEEKGGEAEKKPEGRRGAAKKEEKVEEEEAEPPVATRSSARIRTDSEAKVKEEVKKEATGESPPTSTPTTVTRASPLKRPLKTPGKEPKKELKEAKERKEAATAAANKDKSAKREKKALPEMNYSLPSERNKPSREEVKLVRLNELFNRSLPKRSGSRTKDDESGSGGGRGGGATRRGGRQSTASASSSTTTMTTNERQAAGLSSGRGKRKIDADDAAGKADATTAAAAATPAAPPRKRWAAQHKEAASEESPGPSNNSTASSPAPSGGKKKWLARHNEEQAKAAAKSTASATTPSTSRASGATATATPATTTGGRPKRAAATTAATKREAAEALATLASSGPVVIKHDLMRQEAQAYKRANKTTAFALPAEYGSPPHGELDIAAPSTSRKAPALSEKASAGSSTRRGATEAKETSSSSMMPEAPSVPTPSSVSLPPPAVVKKRLSVEEYRKRKADASFKREAESTTMTTSAQPKKSFIPSIDEAKSLSHLELATSLPTPPRTTRNTAAASTTTSTVTPAAPLVTASGDINEEELRRRVYGVPGTDPAPSLSLAPPPPPSVPPPPPRSARPSDPRGGASASASAPAGKRLSINERLANEFSIKLAPSPAVVAEPPMPEGPPSSAAHHSRFSTRAARPVNLGPPGLLTDIPRPSSIGAPSPSFPTAQTARQSVRASRT